jgi:hypothetical protein
MIAALVCASLAARAAAAVPARANAALLFDGAGAAQAFVPLLRETGKRAPALTAEQASAWLVRAVGVDLLAGGGEWGVAATGPRALVWSTGAVGLVAPVQKTAAARQRLAAWVGEAGSARAAKPRGALFAGSGRSQRAGAVVTIAGGQRLVTASGSEARTLVAALAQPSVRTSLAQDRSLARLLAESKGRAALVVRFAEPLRGAVLDLSPSPEGLVARGMVGAAAPLLAGSAPDASACAGAALLCIRAGLGPSGRALAAAAGRFYATAALAKPEAAALDRAAQQACAGAERVAVSSDGIDARLVGDPASSLWAVRFHATAAGDQLGALAPLDLGGPRSLCARGSGGVAQLATPCADPPATLPAGTGPALEAQLDTAALEAAAARLSPLDALRGSAAAATLAARLMLGGLFRASGPIALSGEPDPLGARVELRWPLR